jgi:hypothetical protein
MRINVRIVFFVILAITVGLFFIKFLPTKILASGNTYYVSPSGNDSNPGTQAQPWKTISKVNSSSFSADDSVLFARGGTWRERLNISSSGTSGHPITFGAYGTGNKPRILGSDNLSNTSDWTVSTANIWHTTTTLSNNVGILVFNNEASMGVKKGSLNQLTSQGYFYYDSISGYLYLYSSSNPGTYYSSIEAGKTQSTILVD